VLGRLVEVVSGQPLDEYLAEHIFHPLGMTETAFSVPESERGRVAKLYGAEPTIAWFDSPLVVDNASGGTITKAA